VRVPLTALERETLTSERLRATLLMSFFAAAAFVFFMGAIGPAR